MHGGFSRFGVNRLDDKALGNCPVLVTYSFCEYADR